MTKRSKNELNLNKMLVKKKSIYIALSMFVGSPLMGGCSSYSNSFDCPYGKGAGCSSVSRVNSMIDNQQIDFSEKDSGAGSSIQMKNIHIFYGPERLSKIVSVQEPLID